MISQLIGIALSIILSPIILLLVIIATLDTLQFGLFRHERVGLHGKPFPLFKIRSLKGKHQSSVTNSDMERTDFGAFIRRYHIDEIPQVLNIALGQMNLVGPRPDTPEMYNLLNSNDFNILTSVKPGLFGIVQLEGLNEEKLLSLKENPEEYYKNVLWKEKVEKNLDYIKRKGEYNEWGIIWKSLKDIFKS